jgi:hypothetical protein
MANKHKNILVPAPKPGAKRPVQVTVTVTPAKPAARGQSKPGQKPAAAASKGSKKK